MLTTVDETGAFVSRPWPSRTPTSNGDLWFLSAKDSRKGTHIQANPHVGAALTSRDVWVSINGAAEWSRTGHGRRTGEPQMAGWFPKVKTTPRS